jgi:hypothetical protein
MFKTSIAIQDEMRRHFESLPGLDQTRLSSMPSKTGAARNWAAPHGGILEQNWPFYRKERKGTFPTRTPKEKCST